MKQSPNTIIVKFNGIDENEKDPQRMSQYQLETLCTEQQTRVTSQKIFMVMNAVGSSVTALMAGVYIGNDLLTGFIATGGAIAAGVNLVKGMNADKAQQPLQDEIDARKLSKAAERNQPVKEAFVENEFSDRIGGIKKFYAYMALKSMQS